MHRPTKTICGRPNPRSAKHVIPSISGWNKYVGGTFAAEGKHAYDFHPFSDGRSKFGIQPISSAHNVNRHIGYQLTAFDIPMGTAYVWIGPGGVGDSNGQASLHRSPQAAAAVARRYYDRVMSGGSIYRENPRRVRRPAR